jgi:hypothetical protein
MHHLKVYQMLVRLQEHVGNATIYFNNSVRMLEQHYSKLTATMAEKKLA